MIYASAVGFPLAEVFFIEKYIKVCYNNKKRGGCVRRSLFLLILLILCMLLLFCACSGEEEVVVPSSIDILKIGKADCIIINTGTHLVMIDTGEEENVDQIHAFMDEHSYDKVDTLILTHYDKDHIGGAKYVIENYGVETVIESCAIADTEEYNSYHQALNALGKEPMKLTQDYTFKNDSCIFNINVPEKSKYDKKNDNNLSLVIAMKCGDNSFLFCGDAMSQRLEEVISELPGEYDLIKLPHHGSYMENYREFFDKIKAPCTVMTTSKKNPADDRTILLLEELGITSYETRGGTVSVTTDGENVEIHQ